MRYCADKHTNAGDNPTPAIVIGVGKKRSWGPIHKKNLTTNLGKTLDKLRIFPKTFCESGPWVAMRKMYRLGGRSTDEERILRVAEQRLSCRCMVAGALYVTDMSLYWTRLLTAN